MSSGDAAFNPLSYHNGTVWPHDNSLCAWGLARHARWPEAHRIVRAMLEAAGTFGNQLPEVFAGFARHRTRFPVVYPTASSPQAWAAATPILLLQIVLGLAPDRAAGVLRSDATELPEWADGLVLEGVRAFDQPWTVRAEDGGVTVEPTDT
jgi:glycogen debranching enzyme